MTPVTLTQPKGASYAVGDAAAALLIEASVSDGGTLSYQWYQSSTESHSGGTAISGATEAAYTPNTQAAGTTYYYVVVTNTKDGKTATVSSDPAKIAVKKAEKSPNSTTNNESNKTSGAKGAKTGDESRGVLYLGLILLSLIGLIAGKKLKYGKDLGSNR